MGTEMKTPESGDSSLRNRKKKENVQEKCEQSIANPLKSSEEKMEADPSKKVEQQQEKILKFKSKSESKSQIDRGSSEGVSESNSNFRLRLEFDPMSIALFTLAIVTRFFKLSEPRNVV